jgi:phenylacetate-CoA ligase
VPYYRELFDSASLRPDDIRSVADIGRIPITTRETIQRRPVREIVASGYDQQRLVVRRTSGSSGEWLAIRRTPAEELLLSAFRWRALYRVGVRPWHRVAVVGLVSTENALAVRAVSRALTTLGLFRKTTVDCRQEPARLAEALRDLRPDVVLGLPGAISSAATEMGAGGGLGLRGRLVVTGGEVLTPLMRRQIVEGFGARVADVYGSHEFRTIAWECRATGEYHTSDDSLVVEVVTDGRAAAPGERGDLVATNLHARAMPFLRFRLADAVVQGTSACPCGAPFGTIREIHGRSVDYFPLPDGRLLHPYELSMNIPDRWPWVRRYQLVQERRDLIRMRIEAYDAPPSDREIADVRAVAADLLGPDVAFEVEMVERVGPDANGKFRVSRTLVPREDGER